jgi:hypothetical protein
MNNLTSELAKINKEIKEHKIRFEKAIKEYEKEEDFYNRRIKHQICENLIVSLKFKENKKQGIILGAKMMKEKILELISKWALNLRPHENIYDADAKITWQDLEILRKGIDNLLADLKELNKEIED